MIFVNQGRQTTFWKFDGCEEGAEVAYTKCFYNNSPGIEPFFERYFRGCYCDTFTMTLPLFLKWCSLNYKLMGVTVLNMLKEDMYKVWYQSNKATS